jgi:hypothetical protein
MVAITEQNFFSLKKFKSLNKELCFGYSNLPKINAL